MTTQIETKGTKIHELKIWPDEYFAVKDGDKTAEFRRNDRDFKRDDLILLREYIPNVEEWLAAGRSWADWTTSFWVDATLKPGIEDEDMAKDEDFDYTPNVDLPRYTGNTILAKVNHVQTGFGIPEGFCVLSIERVRLT